MDERFYDSLELNKILEMLSKECSNEKTKKMALGIKPCSDLYTVKKETGKTAEALELSVRYGTPNFYNTKGPRQAVCFLWASLSR